MTRIRQAYFWPIILVLAAWVLFVGWRVATGPEAYQYPNIEASQ